MESEMNIVVLQGQLSRPPEVRSTSNGDVITYEVTTRPEVGPAVTAPVAWLEPPKAAYGLEQGDLVTVVGQVRRRFFRSGGATQSRTEVVADLVVSSRRRAQISNAFERVFAALEEATPG
jgi:single-strand DNA-binding protein